MADTLTTVFGGTGFLGQYIVSRLHAAGHAVRVAGRSLRAGMFVDAIEQVRSDVRNADSVAMAIDGATGVVNAVGMYVERGGETFDAVHVQGARNVAAAAAGAGARLVHISGIGADAQSPSQYVRARALGERAAAELASELVILRPSVLFGPGDAFLTTLERITRILPVVPLFGTGDTRLQPVYVDDVAVAVTHALTGAAAAGEVYELGGPRSYRYRDLISLVLAYLQRKRVLLPMPFAVWELQSACLSLLPDPPLTRDQIILMRNDNVVGEDARNFADLDIEPRALEALLSECLPS